MTVPTPADRSGPVDVARLQAETFVASVEEHEVLGSTNDRAKSLAGEEGARLPTLILANRQTAGRGRGTNRWWTGEGSLAFTLLVNPDRWGVPRERLPLTSLAAGIALVEAVAPRIASHSVGLHWPNDVYVDDRKLAGILVEMPTPSRLVVGVGVNTNCRLEEAPAELRERVATLIDLSGKRQDHTTLLMEWLNGWEKWVGLLASRREEIGRRADELCLQRGRVLRIRWAEGLHEGRCLGIGVDGALRLETCAGIREFHSGTLE